MKEKNDRESAELSEKKDTNVSKGKLIFTEKRRNQWFDFEYKLYEAQDCKAPYSIEVSVRNGEREKSAILMNCFDLKETAKAFFDIAVRNFITPISLEYVYEDFCE